jgi:hypothetical protein
MPVPLYENSKTSRHQRVYYLCQVRGVGITPFFYAHRYGRGIVPDIIDHAPVA